MSQILILAVLHDEAKNSKISSKEAFAVFAAFKPQVVGIEIAIDEFDIYSEPAIKQDHPQSLENQLFRLIDSEGFVVFSPVDMRGKSREHYNSEYWKKSREIDEILFDGNEILGKNQIFTNFFDILRREDEIATHGSLDDLNGSHWAKLVEKHFELYDSAVATELARLYPDKADFIFADIELRRRRDREIAENIVELSISYERVMVTIGAHHRPVIVKHLVEDFGISQESIVDETWRLTSSST